MTAAAGGRSRLAETSGWVFDLDNTLYPRSTQLFQQIDQRIGAFVAEQLGLSREDAHRLQKDYYRRYGTTLRGLMVEHGIAADAFLAYVHDIDHTPIAANPRLATAIAALPGRKFILTNGSRAHAEKVAARLGVPDHFEDIFDIVRLDLMPKPARQSYDRFVAETGLVPAQAAMFEDLARNLEVPKSLGMVTVLVVSPEGAGGAGDEAWERTGRDGQHIDFVTDDLTRFLEDIVAEISRL